MCLLICYVQEIAPAKQENTKHRKKQIKLRQKGPEGSSPLGGHNHFGVLKCCSYVGYMLLFGSFRIGFSPIQGTGGHNHKVKIVP